MLGAPRWFASLLSEAGGVNVTIVFSDTPPHCLSAAVRYFARGFPALPSSHVSREHALDDVSRWVFPLGYLKIKSQYGV